MFVIAQEKKWFCEKISTIFTYHMDAVKDSVEVILSFLQRKSWILFLPPGPPSWFTRNSHKRHSYHTIQFNWLFKLEAVPTFLETFLKNILGLAPPL